MRAKITMTERPTHDTKTRVAILDAAEAQFSASGYRASRLVDVTDRAGLTTGALYRYFDGKEGLLHALFERFDLELQRRIDRSRTVVDAVTAWLDLARTMPGTMRAYEEAMPSGSPMAATIEVARSRWIAGLATIVPGTATAGKRRILATLICDMVEQYSLVERMGWTQHRPIERVAREIGTLVEVGASAQ